MQQRAESRAGRFMCRFREPVLEKGSADGLPEFQNYPKVRARFAATPQALKNQPASKAHILALTKTVFDAVNSLSAEVNKLKKSLMRPFPHVGARPPVR